MIFNQQVGVGKSEGIKLQSIAITTPPTKTVYNALESFDSTGMVVTATYSNGATLNVGGYIVSPSILTINTESVTITYTEGGVSKTAAQTVTVTKNKVPVPTVSGTLTYNGYLQSPTIINEPSISIATRGGDIDGTNAGNYTKTYTLVDTTNYEWATTFDGNLAWSIGKKSLSITAKAQTIIYGESIATGIEQITANGIAGNDALNSITLTPSTSNVTSNGTITPSEAVVKNGSDVVTANYTISYNTGKLTINKANAVVTAAPTGKTGLVYTGNAQTLINTGIASGGTMQYSLDGTNYSTTAPSATNANTSGYTVYYKVVGDSNHTDTNAQTLTVPIAKADFTATVSINGYTYAGAKSTPTVSNNPGNGAVTYYGRATASGTATAWGSVTSTTYDAGTRYCYAVIAETTNYNGYTTGNTSFTISKATQSVPTLSKSAMTLNTSKTSDTFTVTRNGNGTVTATSSDTSVATVSVSGTTVTVNSVNNTSGTATITVKVGEGTNYNAYTGTAATCAVTAAFKPSAYTAAQIGVTYTDGLSGLTDANISEIAEAISNNSSITSETSEIWVDTYNRHISIGDTISYTLSGTSYSFRVMGFNHYALTSSTAYGSATTTGKAGILMQMVDSFNTKQKMKASMASTDGWHNSDLRTWMNGTMLGYLPSATQSAIKQVNISTAKDVSTATLNTTADNLFLPAEVEVFGSTINARGGTNEGTRYAWYKANDTAANRVKKVNGSANFWWERSPGNWYSGSSLFCLVNKAGSIHYGGASDANGVAPCFNF